MNSAINPNPSGKERKTVGPHRIYVTTACSLAILILGNLANIPTSGVNIKDVISHINDQLDLFVKVQTAYLKACKIPVNRRKDKKDITQQRKSEIDPISPLKHARLIPSKSYLIPDTGTYTIHGTVIAIDETGTSYCRTNMSKMRK
jgi:hypothetical protein